MIIINYDVRWIFIDNENFADILFYDAFQKMKLPPDWLSHVNIILVRFSEDLIIVKREATLLVMAMLIPWQSTMQPTFLVVRVPFAYNIILGQLELHALRTNFSIWTTDIYLFGI